jgi:predicted transcriptional regulator
MLTNMALPDYRKGCEAAEQLLERAYHGSLSLLVSALTRREALPQAEIDELYGLLEEMEGKRHD